MQNGKFFKAPWSRLLRFASFGATIILLCIPIIVAITTSVHVILFRLSLVLPALLLGISSLFTVRGYTIQGSKLRIRRLFWETEVELSGIKTVSLDEEELRRSIRVFGISGLFSFSGWYRNSTLGSYRAYMTNLDHPVILKGISGVVVVSPESPRDFALAVQEAAPGAMLAS
jgi:hypothetical protein